MAKPKKSPHTPKKQPSPICIRLPQPIEAEARKAAKAAGLTFSAYLRAALQCHMNSPRKVKKAA
jgi:hypothetical protein